MEVLQRRLGIFAPVVNGRSGAPTCAPTGRLYPAADHPLTRRREKCCTPTITISNKIFLAKRCAKSCKQFETKLRFCPIINCRSPTLFVHTGSAKPGYGKSALLANWAEHFNQRHARRREKCRAPTISISPNVFFKNRDFARKLMVPGVETSWGTQARRRYHRDALRWVRPRQPLHAHDGPPNHEGVSGAPRDGRGRQGTRGDGQTPTRRAKSVALGQFPERFLQTDAQQANDEKKTSKKNPDFCPPKIKLSESDTFWPHRQ